MYVFPDLSHTKYTNCLYRITNLRVLDLSKNYLKKLPNRLNQLKTIKTLNLSDNKLIKGSLVPISTMTNMQTLLLSNNRIGLEKDGEQKLVGPHLPTLSEKMKTVKLDGNSLTMIPKAIYAPTLTKLESLDLSRNQINIIPEDFCKNLVSLTSLNLDHNLISSLPKEIGLLTKLKSLSIENNKIVVLRTNFDQTYPQPLPSELFKDTSLIDLSLKGNRMTNGQLNEFDGFESFMERRRKIKNKNIHGGALLDTTVCGLE